MGSGGHRAVGQTGQQVGGVGHVGVEVHCEAELELVRAGNEVSDLVAEADRALALTAADGGEVEGVDAGPAGQHVLARTTADEVIARTCGDGVVAVTTEQAVVAFAAIDGVAAAGTNDRVVTSVAVEDVAIRTAVDQVVAIAAVDGVVAGTTFDAVVAVITVELIVAAHAQDGVVAATTVDRIVAVGRGSCGCHVCSRGRQRRVAVGVAGQHLQHRGGVVQVVPGLDRLNRCGRLRLNQAGRVEQDVRRGAVDVAGQGQHVADRRRDPAVAQNACWIRAGGGQGRAAVVDEQDQCRNRGCRVAQVAGQDHFGHFSDFAGWRLVGCDEAEVDRDVVGIGGDTEHHRCHVTGRARGDQNVTSQHG